MSPVNDVSSVKVISNRLIEGVVGKIHLIQVGKATCFVESIADIFIRIFTAQGRAQAAVRKSLQDLAKQINSGGDCKAQFETSHKAFHERLNSLGHYSYTQEQVAPIFKKAMTALASARRNPVEALAADKMEVLNGLLGIKKPVKESSFPYKKVALGVGIAGLFVLAGIAAYTFLTKGQSLQANSPIVPIEEVNGTSSYQPSVTEGLPYEKCPALQNSQSSLLPDLFVEMNSKRVNSKNKQCKLPVFDKSIFIPNDLNQFYQFGR